MRQQLLLLPSFVSEERPRHQSMSDSEYIKTPSLRWSSTRFSPPYHLYPPKLINSSPALIKLFEHPHPKQSKPIHTLLSNARPGQTKPMSSSDAHSHEAFLAATKELPQTVRWIDLVDTDSDSLDCTDVSRGFGCATT